MLWDFLIGIACVVVFAVGVVAQLLVAEGLNVMAEKDRIDSINRAKLKTIKNGWEVKKARIHGWEV